MREAFALQKLLTFFQPKILAYLRYQHLNFNEMLTNDIVSFEQPGPELEIRGGIDDNSKIIFVISQQKHML